MAERKYVRLYVTTAVVALPKGGTPEELAQGVHDTLTAAGFDLLNVVGVTRTTKKQVAATLKDAGLL